MSAADFAQARRILCVRLDSLGDVLMCTPAMRALRHGNGGASLTLLGSPGGVALAPFIPELDAALAYCAPWVKDSAALPARAHIAMADILRAHRFDAAVIFTSFSQSALPAALLCQMAGIPLRLAHCRENPYQLLTHHIAEPEPAAQVRHEVRRQLDLVAAAGYGCDDQRLAFVTRASDRTSVRELLAQHGIEAGAPWILLHPGASAASRRYPPEQWAQAMRLLAADPGCPLVISGSAHEVALVDAIREAAGVTACSLAGKLTLGQLGAAIALARVFVSNNTGPAHIAAALGTPLVDLYALTNPQHTPWKAQHRTLFHDVPCRFCYKSSCPHEHHACLAGVAPIRVAEAARSLMTNKPQPELSAPLRF